MKVGCRLVPGLSLVRAWTRPPFALICERGLKLPKAATMLPSSAQLAPKGDGRAPLRAATPPS